LPKGTKGDIDREVTLPLTIGDVSGLNATLNTINSSLTSLADSETALNTAIGTSANTRIVRGEIPTGAIDGTNATFALANSPSANSVSLFVNGLILRANAIYTITGSTITFSPTYIPQRGDILQADYEVAVSRGFAFRSITLPIPISGVSGLANALNQINVSLSSLNQELVSITTAVAAITCPSQTFGQIPSGELNGTNATFTIASGTVVLPTVSVYDNGLRLMNGVDYTLTASSIQFLPGAIPQGTDLLMVDYCSK
jgi:hypothetical protein